MGRGARDACRMPVVGGNAPDIHSTIERPRGDCAPGPDCHVSPPAGASGPNPVVPFVPTTEPPMASRASASRLDVKELLDVLLAVRAGDFTPRLRGDLTGLGGKAADVLNDVIGMNEALAAELKRLSVAVGEQGRTNERAVLAQASGCWGDCIDAANSLVDDLVRPRAEMARVIAAVAEGDLSQTMAMEMDGRPLTGEFLR